MFRIIRMVRPNFVLIENSSALLVRGGVRVLRDLASIGYDAQWQVVTAKEVGASHERKRLFIVAYPNIFNGKKRMGNIFKRAQTFCKTGTRECFEIWLQTPRESDRMDDGVSPQLYSLATGALGNAIVPPAVVPIMQAIKEIESCPEKNHPPAGRF
jgi:hypothetical protein